MKKTIDKMMGFLLNCMLFLLFTTILMAIYLIGYKSGYNNAPVPENSVATIPKGETKIVYITPKPIIQAQPKTMPKWGGPDLWTAVNKRRVEFGVSGMSSKEELCTIASIRLNQLLELGKLDGHEGFGKLPEERPDIKWIFDKYNISEFLVSGADSPTEAVSLWENTLGHKKLLTGGEYVWGCIYAQNGFGVAIAAY